MYSEATLESEPFLIFCRDNGVSRTISENQSFGFGELVIYQDILNQEGIFFDIGMNIGAISFQLKKRNPSLKIFGFEPIREFYDLAVKNLSKFDDVTCFNIGLGNRKSTVGLPHFPVNRISNFGATELSDVGSEYWVEIQRLDNISELFGVLPNLVKIDVEGQENLVLQGMENLIHDDIYLSIEADRPLVTEKCIDILKDHQLKIYFGALAVTDRLNENRNKDYDNLSTAHIIACYRPTPWIKKLLKPINNYNDYYDRIAPMIDRTLQRHSE